MLWLPQGAQASLFGNSTGNQFVPVDQAFSFDFQQKHDVLHLSWQIRPGYYLYRQQLKFEPQQANIGQVELPAGTTHEDEFYGQVAIFTERLELTVPLTQVSEGGTLRISYQGCAEAGFCYPPETRIVPLSLIAASGQAQTQTTTTALPTVTSAPQEPAESARPFSPLWALLIGIGIAFTPCVLPMYPLISGIILGAQRPQSQKRVLLLALIYVQGMALTYTLLGIVVAAAGMQFQAALQHPAILIGLSLLFILLALSMFGLYSLQLPSSLQTRLADWSNQQRSGSLFGVFMMGALAGLICSPCTTAPLSAILLYIAQSGNTLAGGITLYLYALGMGIPLILVTLFGHRFLPRSGPWMQYVKEGFGFLILALPVFLLERILGDLWGNRMWSLLAVAFFGWAFILSLSSRRGWVRCLQVLLLGATLIFARPLQDWAFGSSANEQTAPLAHLSFAPVNNLAELQAALQQAKGQPVMLDLYADWCVACKEFEKYTFSDAGVAQSLAGVRLLQADVTANDAQHADLLKSLQVLGLPTILFFDAEGNEITAARISGFMNASDFSAHVRRYLASNETNDRLSAPTSENK